MQDDNAILNKDAEAVAAEFKEYAYIVSHDLSGPVRAMVEFSKMLNAEYGNALNGEAKEYLSIIVESGMKMQSMMQGLLEYSRLNTMSKLFVKVDTGRIIEDLRVIQAAEIKASNAVLEVGELPMVEADMEQIMQVFQSLIDNAIKFQPAGNVPHISISAEEKGDLWQFAVADNGIGINPQYGDKIFKLFQRLCTDEECPGVGVGLALTQKVVHRHGGDIWVESALSVGSKFIFTLPKRHNF